MIWLLLAMTCLLISAVAVLEISYLLEMEVWRLGRALDCRRTENGVIHENL